LLISSWPPEKKKTSATTKQTMLMITGIIGSMDRNAGIIKNAMAVNSRITPIMRL